MLHTAALIASLASFGLICAIYFCKVLSSPHSLLRSDMLAMILLSVLTGLFPLAFAASLVGLFKALSAGLSQGAVLSAGIDVLSLGAAIVAAMVFRALVRATYHGA